VDAPAEPVAARTGRMPAYPGVGSITAYSHRDLVALIRWIESGTLLRTQVQLLVEAIDLLGLSSRAARTASTPASRLGDKHGLRLTIGRDGRRPESV
jgi:hypothetical protein